MTKTYDLSIFPIQPGDTFFLRKEDGTVEEKTAVRVGTNEYGETAVTNGTGIPTYEIKNADGSVSRGKEMEDVHTLGRDAFLTEEDAHRKDLPQEYCVLSDEDYNALPYLPGVYYFDDYDGCFARWDIFPKGCPYVFYDQYGEIRVGNEDGDYLVVAGECPDTCFKTVSEAKRYIRKKEGWTGEIRMH